MSRDHEGAAGAGALFMALKPMAAATARRKFGADAGMIGIEPKQLRSSTIRQQKKSQQAKILLTPQLAHRAKARPPLK